MADNKQIFGDKKFPDFIKNHKVFTKIKEVKKVFPEIGIPNSEKHMEVDNTKEAQKAAKDLATSIKAEMHKRLSSLDKYAGKKEDMGVKRKTKLDRSASLIKAVSDQLAAKNVGKCVVSNNGKLTLNLTADVLDTDGKVVFKSGEGLLRVYNKLNEVLREGKFLAMQKFEDKQEFKDFSSKNVPSMKYTIRFSCDGSEGLWDIATMSMRGVSSCQSWGVGNSTAVVGSVVDPFTGIIYLTTGGKFNEYGSKMIRRCVVRFMVNEKKKAPFIALERMYPAMEKATLDAFISFIKEGTDNKFDVIYLGDRNYSAYGHSYVPMSKIVSTLAAHEQPYRDSGISYRIDINDTKNKAKEQLFPKLEVYYASYASKVVAALKLTKVSGMTKDIAAAVAACNAATNSYALYDAMYNDIKDFFSKLNPDKAENHTAFLADSIALLLKSNVEELVFNGLKKQMKKIAKKIDDETIKDISKRGAANVVKYFGGVMKKLVAENKPAKKESQNPAIPIYLKLLE